MAADVDFTGRGLSREDEILARVVVDLGLASPSDVESAIGKLKEGGGASLGQVLQESGNLSKRYLSVVQKAVKSRLSTTEAPVSPKEARRSTVPSQPAEPTRLARRAGGPDAASPPPSLPGQGKPPGGVEQKQILPSLAMPPPQPRVQRSSTTTEDPTAQDAEDAENGTK